MDNGNADGLSRRVSESVIAETVVENLLFNDLRKQQADDVILQQILKALKQQPNKRPTG